MAPLVEVVFRSVRVSLMGFSSTLGPFESDGEAHAAAHYLRTHPRVARSVVPEIRS